MSILPKGRKWLNGVFRRMFATLRNPPDWLIGALGGGVVRSGVHVNPHTALALSAYFASIRAISEDVAKVPLILYERLPGGGKERRTDLPLHKLLHDQPARDMTALTLRETMTAHALGWGNGYAEIVRTRGGDIAALELITPDRVTPAIRNGRVVYDITSPSDQLRTLPAHRMFHLHGLGFDGITGYSIAWLAREAIGLGLAQEQSGSLFFGNSARPSGVLETEGVLDTEAQQDLKKTWRGAYEGPDNAHGTVLLEHGIKFKPITMPMAEAQFIEGRGFSAEDIARFFRVPPPIIGLMEKATHRNVEELFRIYVTLTLTTWFVRWEQEISRKLLTRPSESELFAEHLADGLLRGDLASRNKAYAIARQWGWLNVNDIRALENMNPIGPQGDVYLEPMNMTPAGESDEPEPDDSDENEDTDDLAAIRKARIRGNGELDRIRDKITESMNEPDRPLTDEEFIESATGPPPDTSKED